MKNILITGTNGMIGSLILHYCLEREDVHTVTSITRKQTGIRHPKLAEILHTDFRLLNNSGTLTKPGYMFLLHRRVYRTGTQKRIQKDNS